MSSLVENATIKIRRDSAANWTSNNPTPASGEWCIETDTGQVKIGDGSTAWNAKGYHIKNPESFDISSSNQVYNLPAVKGGQKEIIKWSGGDGTYKLTFTTQGSDTIGGLAASVWEGEGEGIIVLSDDGGTDWVAQEYEDLITYGSGEAGTHTVEKGLSEMIIRGWTYLTGNGTSNTGESAQNLNKSFSNVDYIDAVSGSIGYKSASNPTSRTDVTGPAGEHSICRAVSTSQILLSANGYNGAVIGTGTRILISFILKGPWR